VIADHGHRIGRVELGICAGFLIILGGGWALYSKLDDRVTTVALSQEDMKGQIGTLGAKIDMVSKQIDDQHPTTNARNAKP